MTRRKNKQTELDALIEKKSRENREWIEVEKRFAAHFAVPATRCNEDGLGRTWAEYWRNVEGEP